MADLKIESVVGRSEFRMVFNIQIGQAAHPYITMCKSRYEMHLRKCPAQTDEAGLLCARADCVALMLFTHTDY